MIENIMVVTKDEAKKIIDNAPGDSVVLITLNTKTYVHSVGKRIQKTNSEIFLDNAKKILYQDNDFFGTMSLYGIVQKEEDAIIHNLLFPQLE